VYVEDVCKARRALKEQLARELECRGIASVGSCYELEERLREQVRTAFAAASCPTQSTQLCPALAQLRLERSAHEAEHEPIRRFDEDIARLRDYELWQLAAEEFDVACLNTR
jgi:hypothetical protein